MAAQDEIKRPRIKMVYDTQVNGTPEPKELPLRLMFFGDFSGGTSKDRKKDFVDRDVRSFDGSNTNDVMRDMDISVKMTVPNKINPAEEESIDVDIPIDSIDAFNPEQVARNIPKVRALLELKRLLIEGATAVGNIPALAKMLKDVYGNKEAYDSLKKQLAPLESLKLTYGNAQE